MTVPPVSIVGRNDALLFTQLDDTIVMMDMDEGTYYELDPIGSRIWNLLDRARPVDDLCAALLAEYEVDADTCRRDVGIFLEEASARGIIHLQPKGDEPVTS